MNDYDQRLTDLEDEAFDRKTQTKAVIKEALKEWMDEKFAAFGRWSIIGIGAAALFALMYFILAVKGWKFSG
jgi:hypothetical protein